jgi:hypothetical protein
MSSSNDIFKQEKLNGRLTPNGSRLNEIANKLANYSCIPETKMLDTNQIYRTKLHKFYSICEKIFPMPQS